MRIMLDFECSGDSCGRIEEHIVESHTETVDCPCGGVMKRCLSAPTIRLEGISGAFPTAHDHWAKIREEKARIDSGKSRPTT